MKAMICPRCKTNLVFIVDLDIEMDQCPACEGVWLDRGEFNKIIEQSKNYSSTNGNANEDDSHYENDDEYEREHDNRYNYGWYGYRNQTRRQKGFLFELYDF
jgi:uncharacterized protein